VTRDFYEFFAGGGMVRAGLGSGWRCIFANDFDHKKSRIYRENWGTGELKTADIRSLVTAEIPSVARLAWASFPCQDLSLAGWGAGLKGDRSGTFWPFWKLMNGLVQEGRAPQLIALENVCGTLNSHEGKDFAAICDAVTDAGYLVGAMVVDAALFTPHSRPRLFIVCPRADLELPPHLIGAGPEEPWHTSSLRSAFKNLPSNVRSNWVWWSMPLPPKRTKSFSDLIEDDPADVDWFTQKETSKLIAMMSELNRDKLAEAKRKNRRVVGGLYRRTRHDENGLKVQRAEIRFDDLSGCLRTPAGGSSRQVVLVVHGQSVGARLISGRETARLMGLPDTYTLPENYNEAYHLTGDGVVVPVVRHLAQHIFEPILDAAEPGTTIAA
jgi:DNA (cytosine-5)-methyltransferase 1